MAKKERTRARAVLLIAGLLLVTIIGGVLVGGNASASHRRGDPYITRTRSVHPNTITLPPPPPPPCCDPVMPVTGADITLFAVTGFAGVATGAVLVRRTRIRKRTPKA